MRREVNDFSQDATLLRTVDVLGRRGLYARTIARVTGLSIGQVSYRLKRLQVRLGAYREGTSPESAKIIEVSPCSRLNVQAVKGQTYKVVGIKIS